MTYSQILEAQRLLDEGLLNLNEEQMKELGDLDRRKLDSYHLFDKHLESRITFFEAERDEITEIIDSLKATKKESNQRLIDLLNAEKVSHRSGFDYVATVVTKERNKTIPIRLPTFKDFLKFGEKFVKKTYTWNLKETKELIKSSEDSEELEKLFTLKDSQNIKFTRNKGLKNYGK